MDSLNPLKTKELYCFDEYKIDVEERRLVHKEEIIPLTPKEFEVLFYLVERAGSVCEKNELLDAIWADTFVEEATLARNISWLRKKLSKKSKGEKFIKTVPRRGYCFVAEVFRTDNNDNIIVIEEQTLKHFRSEETFTFTNDTSKDVPQQTAPALPAPKFNNKYLKLVVVVLGLIMLTGTGFTIYQNLKAKDGVKAIVAKRVWSLTGESGNEDDPKFSPDGKRIVYSMKTADGDNRNIYVRQINVGDSVKITDSKVNDRYPTFSPDGSHIGFLREYKDYGELITVPSLGGNERVIRRLFSGNYSVSYSPINDDIAVIDTEDSKVGGQYAVYLVNTQTFKRRRLTAPGDFEGETTPRFSPDGKNVAFVRLIDRKQDLFVVPSSGGKPRRLTFDKATIHSLSWSPNGEEIYFVSYREGKKKKLWRILVAGGDAELISIGSEHIVNIAISPNGKMLAFSADRAKSSIYRLKPDGQPAQKFITSNGSDQVDQYSPDGSRILFRSNRMRDTSIWHAVDIWTANAEGKDQHRITDSMDIIEYPSFSSDGSQILVNGEKNDKSGIFIVSAKGGELVEFKTERHKVGAAKFSVDGEWIYFNSNKNGKYQIWKIKSDGTGEAIQITGDDVYYAQPALDGKMIYYVKSFSDGIWRNSTDGGVEDKIKAIADAGFKNIILNKPDVTPDHWKVTDKGIYFLIRKPDKSYEMKFYDFATEKVTEAVGSDKIPKNITGLFATDGTNFLFNVEEKVSNIMLADLQ